MPLSQPALPARIAVTGASGSLGTALLRRIRHTDATVVAISRRPPGPMRSPYDRASCLPTWSA